MGTIVDSIFIERFSIAFIPQADTMLCFGDLLEIAPSGDFTSYQVFNMQQDEVATISLSGQYTVAYTQDDCIATDSFEVGIYPRVEVEIDQLEEGCLASGDVIAYHISATADVSYTWNNATSNPPLQTSLRENVLEVLDGNGCIRVYTLQVEEDCRGLIHIPNAVSPNGDGLNDIFKPIIDGSASYTVRIYSRWGEQIAEFDESSNGWDAADVPIGAYLVTVDMLDAENKVHYLKQTLTVVR
jgi:gliding motility-associated-like protein